MKQDIQTRRACGDDFDFAWQLYAESVKPNIIAFMKRPWNDEDEKRRFGTIWKPEQTSIILFDNERVGWFAVEDNGSEVVIENAFITPKYRGRGIGSSAMRQILDSEIARGKPTTMSILKNSSHQGWFKKFGFQVEGEKEHLVQLRRPIPQQSSGS